MEVKYNIYPKALIPTEFEIFKIGDQTFEVPKCIVKFEKWDGEPVKETFGGKTIVKVNGKPMFAELAILEKFIGDGWQSRWIETYGKSKSEPICLSEWKDDKYKNQIHHPITNKTILNLLSEITAKNENSFSGCWDVLAWKDDKIIFAESKRKKKDSIRSTQNNWLSAGLKSGLKLNNFLIVQWDL